MRYVCSSQSCALATLSVEHDCRTANALASFCHGNVKVSTQYGSTGLQRGEVQSARKRFH